MNYSVETYLTPFEIVLKAINHKYVLMDNLFRIAECGASLFIQERAMANG